VTELSDHEMVGIFKQHLKVLGEMRDAALAQITASREMTAVGE
jgi:hypothetical protein